MKITASWLEENNFCQAHVGYFNEHFTEIEHTDLINHLFSKDDTDDVERMEFANWLICSIFTRKNCILYASYAASYANTYANNNNNNDDDDDSDAAGCISTATGCANAISTADEADVAAYAHTASTCAAEAAKATYAAYVDATYFASDENDDAITEVYKKALIKLLNYAIDLLNNEISPSIKK